LFKKPLYKTPSFLARRRGSGTDREGKKGNSKDFDQEKARKGKKNARARETSTNDNVVGEAAFTRSVT